MTGGESTNAIVHAAGGYGPPGGGGYGGPPPGAPPGGGGYGGPPGGYGGPPGGGGYGGPPGGPPPGGYGGPPQAPPPGGYGGGGFGQPPGGYGGGFGGGGFGPPGGGFAPPGGPMGPGMGDDINTTLPMILSIVAMIFCCGISFFLGIGGLVLSIQAGNSKKTGDMESARSKAKTALILAIVALAIGLLQGIGYGILNAMNH